MTDTASWTLDAVDLFAGPGGWDVAARELGLGVMGLELDKWACKTRVRAGLSTAEVDVREYGPADFPAVGLIASPPCQTFSAAGNGAGRAALDVVVQAMHELATDGAYSHEFTDERTALVLEPLRWALEAHDMGHAYRWIALEQVPTVLPLWLAMGPVLAGLGYTVSAGYVHAEQYGVPQTRKRAILVAKLDGLARLPVPTHSKYHTRQPTKLDEGVLPWVSMAQALGWDKAMWSQYGGTTHTTESRIRDADEPAWTMTSKANRNRWVMRRNSGPGAAREPRPVDAPSYTIRANGSGSHPSGVEWEETPDAFCATNVRPNAAVDQPAPTLAFGHEKPLWVYNRPSTTIVGSFRPDIVAAPGWRKPGDGPRQKAPGSVRVTPQQAAVLQTFPEDYPWQGGTNKVYQQIGNAVPPVLAQAVLQEVTT